MEELIVGKASDLFFAYGLKSISMDDLAKDAGVSKKTIYQFVADKKELVIKVAQHLVQRHSDVVADSYATAANAVEEVALQARQTLVCLAPVRYSFFYDMERFYPEGWQLVQQYRQQQLLPCIIRNLERGISEGLFRPDIDLELTPHIRLQQLDSVLRPGAFSAFQNNMQQLMERLTRFYLHGITSPAGNLLIDKYLQANNNL